MLFTEKKLAITKLFFYKVHHLKKENKMILGNKILIERKF